MIFEPKEIISQAEILELLGVQRGALKNGKYRNWLIAPEPDFLGRPGVVLFDTEASALHSVTLTKLHMARGYRVTIIVENQVEDLRARQKISWRIGEDGHVGKLQFRNVGNLPVSCSDLLPDTKAVVSALQDRTLRGVKGFVKQNTLNK